MPVVPNLFIVGSWKAGTTSLYHYLKAHPDIFMSEVKEPHYFVRGSSLRPRLSTYLPSYKGLFRHAGSKRIAGEASAHYLTSPESATLIHAFNPQAKIIIMLRNPVDAIHAFYYECVALGREKSDLHSAMTGDGASRIDYTGLVMSWPARIRDYWRLFGKKQVKIIMLEDMAKDPAHEYNDILGFLGVEKFLPEFRVYNESKKPPPAWLRIMSNNAITVCLMQLLYLSPACAEAIEKLRMRAQKPLARPPMDGMLRRQLETMLAPTVDELSAMLGRDLSHWKSA